MPFLEIIPLYHNMDKEKNNFNTVNRESNLEAYETNGQVSLKAMNFGLWLAKNRRKMRRGFIILLISLSVFFFSFSLYHLVSYIFNGNFRSQLASDGFVLSPRAVTSELNISPISIFPSNGRHDLVVKLDNPNDNFSAIFSYCFSRDEEDVACGNDFILPGAEKYLLILGRDLSSGQDGVRFTLNSISWRRVDARKIASWSEFMSERLNFTIENLKFSAADQSAWSDKIGLNGLEFSVNNLSPYGYYEAPFNILLFSGNELVGVNRHLLINYMAGETRKVNLIWPGNLRSVSRVEIVADLNILDDSIFLKYQGLR